MTVWSGPFLLLWSLLWVHTETEVITLWLNLHLLFLLFFFQPPQVKAKQNLFYKWCHKSTLKFQQKNKFYEEVLFCLVIFYIRHACKTLNPWLCHGDRYICFISTPSHHQSVSLIPTSPLAVYEPSLCAAAMLSRPVWWFGVKSCAESQTAPHHDAKLL